MYHVSIKSLYFSFYVSCLCFGKRISRFYFYSTKLWTAGLTSFYWPIVSAEETGGLTFRRR